MDQKPLVSICTTFFNGGRYIHRLLESCLNQTYKNIEVVIVDDASTDSSQKVITEYAARDPRVKYFRNDEKIRIARSFVKMFNLAKGDFAMVLGADDWISRSYIENGVRTFLEHPDVAGVIPDLTTLFEYGDKGVFTFESRKSFPQGLHSADWFARRMYKPVHFYISGYALVRREDLVSAMDYYIKNYHSNPSQSTPEELERFFDRVFGIDSMMFLEILTRYKNLIFDSSLNYIKISHSGNQTFNVKKDSLYEIFKQAYYYLLIYKYIYKPKWPKFYRGMKIFRGAQAISTAFIYFLGNIFHFFSLGISVSKGMISKFFGEYAFFEIVISVAYSLLMTVSRLLSAAKKKFVKNKRRYEREKSLILVRENFLNSEKQFTLN